MVGEGEGDDCDVGVGRVGGPAINERVSVVCVVRGDRVGVKVEVVFRKEVLEGEPNVFGGGLYWGVVVGECDVPVSHDICVGKGLECICLGGDGPLVEEGDFLRVNIWEVRRDPEGGRGVWGGLGRDGGDSGVGVQGDGGEGGSGEDCGAFGVGGTEAPVRLPAFELQGMGEVL